MPKGYTALFERHHKARQENGRKALAEALAMDDVHPADPMVEREREWRRQHAESGALGHVAVIVDDEIEFFAETEEYAFHLMFMNQGLEAARKAAYVPVPKSYRPRCSKLGCDNIREPDRPFCAEHNGP
jgi:hypothetical protein